MRVNSDNGCVLLVDDDEAMRESLEEFLNACGFKVRTANSVDGALKLLEKEMDVEVIVSDMKMPHRTGIDLLHLLNENKRQIPVIFLTGHGSFETCQEAVRSGAFDYIVKPIDHKDKIILPLRHAIEKFRLEKNNAEIRRELEVFYQASTGREERILELKEEVERLKRELESKRQG